MELSATLKASLSLLLRITGWEGAECHEPCTATSQVTSHICARIFLTRTDLSQGCLQQIVYSKWYMGSSDITLRNIEVHVSDDEVLFGLETVEYSL